VHLLSKLLRFVSAIHIPSSMPDTLVSGGGDAMLKIWNWQSGKLTGEIPVLEVITPFIVVLPVRPGRRVETGDGEGKPHGRKGRAKAKRSKARTEQNIEDSGSAGTFDTPPTGDVEIPAVDIDEAMPDAPTPEVTTRTPDTAEPVAPADADAPQELVLVIAKIRTFTPPSSSPTLVFSATGCVSSLLPLQ
jgi:tRNA (guanine-N(7)-)-methyltransferase subunit TRM82